MLRPCLYKNLVLVILSIFIATPVAAHTVKVSENVGGLLHIEPQDNPRAGESAKIWIVLTRHGGETIPLEKCNCQLSIYPKPHTKGNTPLLKPTLQAITAEKYRGVPGADVVFPKAGAYEIEISGTPKPGASFKPFKLSYTVNVSS
ncbi:hypothetical protein G7B40_006925 [Aetokthonos hydrillicola Thurmond2011]|uniref:Transketolase n=1 Tax=Aetokthonos hydrillicola Thurmond2011 TaxID=2712845 RepID=A0AAP5M6P6_9CYAN|nr:hypothetical protein [Aetokthonos hydrillicola]MBO3463516.1 hypothetical protein [Aetokthonos hydrillicola CCALA 1050]MBW4584936.1 hypothetical protein [Aetokthonos hydrillicola CCALA 1050]MDR9894305.1 hypothetical protein [Aetokthonos hydrillicola Thurmond2011]